MSGSVCIAEGFNFFFSVTYVEMCLNLIYFGESSLLKTMPNSHRYCPCLS